MADDFKYDVFLSHSSKDKDVVRAVAERLRADELRVWFDDWEIRAGDSIPARIEEGLEHSRVLVLCMSANAFGSDWAQLEAGTFRFRDPLNKERRFIPLRLDAAPIKGSLAQFLYINWLPDNREQEYATLLEACDPAAKPVEATVANTQRADHPPNSNLFAETGVNSRSRQLNNARDYVQSVIDIIQGTSHLDIFCMDRVFPYILYPQQVDDFLRIRKYESQTRSTLMGVGELVSQYHEAFNRAYARGVTFRYFLGISSVDYYRRILHGTFQSRSETILDGIKTRLHEADVTILVGANAPDFCLFLTETNCLFAIIDPKNPGTVTSDGTVIRTYSKSFEQRFTTGKPLERWWNDIVRNRSCRFTSP